MTLFHPDHYTAPYGGDMGKQPRKSKTAAEPQDDFVPIDILPGTVTAVEAEYDERLGEVLRPLTHDFRRLPDGRQDEQSQPTSRKRRSASDQSALLKNKIERVIAAARASGIPKTASNMAGPLAKELARPERQLGYGEESIRKILTGRLKQQRELGIVGYFT